MLGKMVKKLKKVCSREQKETEGLSRKLEENLMLWQKVLGKNSDLVIREFVLEGSGNLRAALIFFENLVDKKIIVEGILKPLLSRDFSQLAGAQGLNFIAEQKLAIGEIKKSTSFHDLLNGCLSGDSILLIDGFAEALILETKGWEKRAVTESQTDVVVRGPREGFTETLWVNLALLRRKIRHPDFVLEKMQLGEKTKTEICLAYLQRVVKPALVQEVKERLQRIKTDAILESGYVEQFIEDAPGSFFPTVAYSEKPDVIAAKVLEGRVAILVDGTPFVLTVPKLFLEGFQSAEDYYLRPFYVSLIRLLRYFSFLISLMAPAGYVALTSYHQELIPTPLLFTVAAAREGTPFPVAVEVLLLGFFFEVVREAGVRLPRPIGPTISIVGALVVGQSAVTAGLIGAPIIIVVAITALTTFVVNDFFEVLLLLRVILILAAAFLGGYGIMLFLLWVLIYLNSLRSFGVPYLTPFAPLEVSGLKDTFIRFPLWAMWLRPRDLNDFARQRQSLEAKPKSPGEEGQ